MINLNKKNIIISLAVIVFGLAAILRLWQLGKIPVSMSDDETRLTYSAYSIWETGRDINNRMLPLTFPISGYAFNPVPIYLTSPFVGILGLSMFSARLPFALAGILSVVLLYLIAELLFKEKFIALFSAAVLTFSAWHLQLSRFAYEGGIALFFYLLAIYFFLRVKRNKYPALTVALISLVLAFYSYSGYKLTFVPLVLVLVWYKLRDINLKQLLVIFSAVVFAFALFFYLGKTQGALTYGGNLFFFQDKAAMETAVELERRASRAPEKLKEIYHNKLTYVWNIFIHRYEYAFSPQYLFSDQEESGIFSLWGRGQMYYVDALLIFLGAVYLILKKRKEFYLIISFLLIAPLPSGLGPEPVNYTIRSGFMLPGLVILAGAGLYSLGFFIANRKILLAAGVVMTVIYLYFIGGYLTQYYFDWGRYSAVYYAKTDQDLAYFLLQEKNNREKIIVTGFQPMTLLHFVFYDKLPPQSLQNNPEARELSFGNISFVRKCPDLILTDPRLIIPKNSLYLVPAGCIGKNIPNEAPHRYDRILKSPDGISEWYIYST